MKISVSSYSFDKYIKDGRLTQLDCVKKAHELGFDAIEFTELSGTNTEEQKALATDIRKAADELGIEINAYTIGANLYHDDTDASKKEIERLKTQLEVAKALGAPLMRHDVCYKLGKTGNSRSFGLMLHTIAENARQVTEYAKTLGIKTCTENHGFISQDSIRVEALFNAVANDNFGILVDIGNFLCVDEDPVTAVSRLAPYAIHVHVKDFERREASGNNVITTRGANYISGTVLGEGVVPVKQCLKILTRAGYDGYISLEYEGSVDCIDGISRGLANLKNILNEL